MGVSSVLHVFVTVRPSTRYPVNGGLRRSHRLSARFWEGRNLCRDWNDDSSEVRPVALEKANQPPCPASCFCSVQEKYGAPEDEFLLIVGLGVISIGRMLNLTRADGTGNFRIANSCNFIHTAHSLALLYDCDCTLFLHAVRCLFTQVVYFMSVSNRD